MKLMPISARDAAEAPDIFRRELENAINGKIQKCPNEIIKIITDPITDLFCASCSGAYVDNDIFNYEVNRITNKIQNLNFEIQLAVIVDILKAIQTDHKWF